MRKNLQYIEGEKNLSKIFCRFGGKIQYVKVDGSLSRNELPSLKTEYVGEVEHLGRCKLNTIVAIN